jgi:ribonuclease HI
MKDTLFSNSKLIIYTDGGSRGNPGKAAIGVVVGEKEYSEYIGIKTNNQAEYMALVFAFKKTRQLLGKDKSKKTELEVRMDSELIVRQLNGQYKILDTELQPFFLEVWNLRLDFKSVVFTHIPREQNKKADALVNYALDNNR